MTGISFASNSAAISAQTQLKRSGERLGSVIERLSSGLRISSASDDPAGLALSSGLRADSRILGQAVRNVNDGISVLNLQESALVELKNIVDRLEELATSAASSTLTVGERIVLQEESSSLTEEFNRIVQSTESNGRSLLEGSAELLAIQAGQGSFGGISFFLKDDLQRSAGTGALTNGGSLTVAGIPQDLATADVNGDGNLDIIATVASSDSINVKLGNGNGTFTIGATFEAGGTPVEVVMADFNNDSVLDALVNGAGTGVSVLLGNSNGTFANDSNFQISSGIVESAQAGDFDGDGNLDILALDSTANYINVRLGNGNGTFDIRTSFALGSSTDNALIGDFNGDGNLDTAVSFAGAMGILLGTGTGSFADIVTYAGSFSNPGQMSAGDFNRDGLTDIAVSGGNIFSIVLANSDGTLQAAVSYAAGGGTTGIIADDVNGDGLLDVTVLVSSTTARVYLGSGGTSFGSGINYSGSITSATRITAGDYNSDGALDFAFADQAAAGIDLLIGVAANVTDIEDFDLTSAAAAQESMQLIEINKQRVSLELANAVAQRSRLEVALSNTETQRLSFDNAVSAIESIDAAAETAELVRQQVIQQSATAVLAQANLQPARAFALIEAVLG